ncbi:MAG: bifunctional [glutamine synthetase] adenylyltransferase/[glutamine synthetase]-adenylyl-L-tyrosine phosphorylase [Nocardioidaceae bacterium]
MTDERVSRTGRLARLGFGDVAAAARDWGIIELDEEGLLKQLAEAADPDLAIRSLARLVVAAGPDAGDIRAALRSDQDLGRRLTLVLGASAALADHLVRHPRDWRVLADPSLELVRPAAGSISASLATATDPDELRRTYRGHLLRLAARDLGMQLRVDDAAAELADLAAGTIDAALSIARHQLGESAGSCRLAVIGMGKCGARELNYVSDVDVIFVAEPSPGTQETTALQAATAIAAAAMRICSDHTAEGTLWPVDAGLRPEGRSGPLVRTLASHEQYYRRWARTWEFQALLKARPIAGDPLLGGRFVDLVMPMVWAAADRPDFVAEVQAMRRRVVDQLPAHEQDRQLKLGPGGLRDIEFAVQLLQLVHGRSDTSVRAANTQQALEALTASGYVGREDGHSLAEAYRFLRTIEHRLQLSHLRRTHVMPTDPAALRVLGRSVGLKAHPVDELTRVWRRHAREVRRLHEKLFYRPLLEAVAAIPGEAVRLTEGAARQRLEALGYADPAAALRHIQALTAGVARRALIQRALLPAMLGWFADAPDPDSGLLGFRRLSDALGSSHWYLRMLRDEGAAAERLATLLASSAYSTELLMRAPEATALIAHDEDLAPREADLLVAEAHAAAARQSDPIEAITAVRAVRRRELFRVSAADIFRLLDVDETGEALTAVSRATLVGGLTAATAAVAGQRGAPLTTRLAVIAMGRLGGHEMSYSSDADVLFVHAPCDGADEQQAHDDAFAVAGELTRLLALPGPDPALGIDSGLRPEGRQGPLVRTLASYAAYYARWSKVWEAQALLRAEPIAGDPDVGSSFIELIDPLRYPSGGLSVAEVTEVRRIKARVEAERLPRAADPATHLKLGRGGLADVEWTVQLLQMRFAHACPGLRSTRTLQPLEAAVDAGLVAKDAAAELAQSWRLASRIRNASMLVRGRPSDSLPSGARDRLGIAYLCGYDEDDSGRLIEDYLRLARRARSAMEAIFWS